MKLRQTLIIGIVILLSAVSRADELTVEAIQIQRQGLTNLIRYMDNHADIFNRANASHELLNLQQKQTVTDVWLQYLDYMTALSELSDSSRDYLSLYGEARAERKQEHALAFYAHYRFGLEFIHRIKSDKELVKWLNSDVNDADLPENFFNRFTRAFLSDWATDEYDLFHRSFRYSSTSPLAEDLAIEQLAVATIHRTSMLAHDSVDYLNRTVYRTWYPVQKYVARGMGKVKVWRINNTLITPEQALRFSRDFEPGDFFFTRKEWRLTNVGIPGFWTHSALYIGTPTERAHFFDTPEVNQWLLELGYSSFEDMLNATSEGYASHPGQDYLGAIRVLEVLDAGAIFNSIETSLDADGAAVFRPRLSKLEKAKAIRNAFHYVGRPYDFHFDFDSDSAMLCSELIYKAYEPSRDQVGIDFPLFRSAGKKILTPNDMARWFDETEGSSEQQLDLVMFIDSNEKEGIAFKSTAENFTGTWKRPDWHVFRQSAIEDPDRYADSGQNDTVVD